MSEVGWEVKGDDILAFCSLYQPLQAHQLFLPVWDNPLPQRITNFLLPVILLSELLKQHPYILFFQRYSGRVTEGLIKGICYLSSYFILNFKSASTEGIKWEKNRPSFFTALLHQLLPVSDVARDFCRAKLCNMVGATTFGSDSQVIADIISQQILM